MKNKKVIKCVSLLICLVCLLLCCVCPVVALDYSENSPSYIREKGNFYIEISSVELGTGTILLANNYRVDILSTYGNSQQLYNTTSSTISGYLYTTSNNYYQIRFTSLNTPQYYVQGTGINYGWQDLTINQLVSTNGSIKGDNGIKVYFYSDFEKILISAIIIFFVLFFIFSGVRFVISFKKRDF